MRPRLSRSHASALLWTSIFTLPALTAGCQQWSFRKNMSGFFGAETKDDWEPPTASPREVAGAASKPETQVGRARWSRQADHPVPRVVLPRDRGEDPSRIRSEPSASVAMDTTAPKLPAVQWAPQESFKEQPIDTGIDAVDLEASLRSLPPEFREVVQRTLESVQRGSESEPPSNGPIKARLTESTLDESLAANSNEPAHQERIALPSANVAVATSQPKTQDPVVRTSASAPADGPTSPPAKSATWHSTISEAIELLERELESNPSSDESLRRNQEITLRILYVAQRRLDDALRPIDRMDAHEQEYVRHQMQALYEASNPDANPSRTRHWSTVMMSQREATSHLSAVSNLEVRSVAFCTQVDGYGTYQKFAKNQFTADQDVLLYCEIDNVAAEAVKAGFQTQLQGSYEIRDAQGRLIADQELPMEPEICSNHRRDYFMVYRIYMPSEISPGNYELRLTIQDKKGGKYGHSNVAFEIRR